MTIISSWSISFGNASITRAASDAGPAIFRVNSPSLSTVNAPRPCAIAPMNANASRFVAIRLLLHRLPFPAAQETARDERQVKQMPAVPTAGRPVHLAFFLRRDKHERRPLQRLR